MYREYSDFICPCKQVYILAQKMEGGGGEGGTVLAKCFIITHIHEQNKKERKVN